MRLDYATGRRRRQTHVRRWVGTATVAVVVFAGWWFWPDLSTNVRHRYLQHRAATYMAPAGEVVYEEDPFAVASLARRGYTTATRMDGQLTATRDAPAEARTLYQISLGLGSLSQNVPFGSAASQWPLGVVFLHARRTPRGIRRIVAVHRVGEFFGAGDDRVHSYYSYVLIEPRGGDAPQVRETGTVFADPAFPKKVNRDAAGPAAADRGPIRFFAGQVDPNDGGRFVLPYELDGVRKEVGVRLVDDGADVGLQFDGQP